MPVTWYLNLLESFKMKDALKKVLSKRAIVIVLLALLVLSAFNTYLIFVGTQSSMSTNAVSYDYVLSQDGNNYKLKNMFTGYVAEQTASTSSMLNSALTAGKSVYLNPGTYVLTEDIIISNKMNAKIVSNNEATIIGNGKKIIVYGDNYTTSQNALISGLTIINATIRVENSFGTTISNTIFENTTTGIEFANTNTWSEYNKIENCQFINATEGIAFRTPVGNGTGSYASTEIDRVSFKLKDFSVGIKVEALAEFSDSQIQNVRFWIGENGRANQTGLLVDGSMFQTLLFGVVFESFTSDPVYLFGIDIGDNCNPAPILDGGVSFLGNWTAKVHDSQGIWLSATGAQFKRENVNVPVGTNNQYGLNETIQVRPLTIFSFKPKIEASGSFSNNETVTVRVRIEYIDNIISDPVVRTFTSSGSVWLSDDDMMQLFPSQSIIWAILVDAKSSSSSTDAVVKVSGYGTAG
ncbi:MAG: hypothetical protein M1490_04730 [Candidatus Bathyarchaeota archaeon]|nr:hypothetical protein [Candidatus Bathyarchaeota archaeon]